MPGLGTRAVREDDIHVVKTFLDEGLEPRMRKPCRQQGDDIGILKVVSGATDDAAALSRAQKAVGASESRFHECEVRPIMVR